MLLSKTKIERSDWFLIGANLVPVYGVWFLQWSAWEVFVIYALETILIGVFTLLKLGISTAYRKRDVWQNGQSVTRVSGLFFMFFFLVHYGFFVAIQLALFFNVSGFGNQQQTAPEFIQFITNLNQYITADGWLMLSIFLMGYGYKTMQEFILTKKYQTAPLMLTMFEPYGRIIIQQFTVIAGSIFLGFGAGKIFILIFTLVKIYFSFVFKMDRLISRRMTKALGQDNNSSHS